MWCRLMGEGLVKRLVIANPEPGNGVAVHKADRAVVASNSSRPKFRVSRKSVETQAGMRGIGHEVAES